MFIFAFGCRHPTSDTKKMTEAVAQVYTITITNSAAKTTVNFDTCCELETAHSGSGDIGAKNLFFCM